MQWPVRACELDDLRAFEAAARLGSFAGAGEELSVSAGAISRHIEELERELGVSILESEGRDVRLTDDGRSLCGSLQPAFAKIDGAWREARRASRRARLTLTVPPAFARTWLLPRLPGFRRLAPEVDLVIGEGTADEAPGEDAADMAIELADRGEGGGEFVVERLTDEEVFPVCAPEAWPQEGGLDRATLLHCHPLPPGAGMPDWPGFLEAAGLGVAAPLAGPRIAAALIVDAARAGCGVALATGTDARDDLAAGRLVRPVPESVKTACGYRLRVRPASAGRPEVRTFRAWLREELAGGSGPPPPAAG